MLQPYDTTLKLVLLITNSFLFHRDAKKKLTISYPCVMLNVDVARNNTNDQYQVCCILSACLIRKYICFMLVKRNTFCPQL